MAFVSISHIANQNHRPPAGGIMPRVLLVQWHLLPTTKGHSLGSATLPEGRGGPKKHRSHRSVSPGGGPGTQSPHRYSKPRWGHPATLPEGEILLQAPEGATTSLTQDQEIGYAGAIFLTFARVVVWQTSGSR